MKRGVRLAISVASGILAFALASWYGASIRAEAARERQELLAAYGGDVVSVCVATRDVDAGELIDEGDIELTEWVAGLLPADSATSIDEVVGKRATSNIPARAVLCPAYFQERGGTLEVPEGVGRRLGAGGFRACGGWHARMRRHGRRVPGGNRYRRSRLPCSGHRDECGRNRWNIGRFELGDGRGRARSCLGTPGSHGERVGKPGRSRV